MKITCIDTLPDTWKYISMVCCGI